MISDAILLQRYAGSRDAAAFAELSARYAGLVYSTCLRVLGNAADAEDATQECFLELARKAGAIHSSLPGWLHALARSRAIDAVRKNATRRHYEQQAGPPRGDTDDRTWAEISPYVDEALAALPDNLRVPIILHYLHGETQADIATRQNTTQATISRQLEKGLEKLREHLRKRGVVVSVAVLSALLLHHGVTAVPATLTAALGKMAISGVGGATAVPTISIFASMGAKMALSLVICAVVVTGWGVVAAKRAQLAATSAAPTSYYKAPKSGLYQALQQQPQGNTPAARQAVIRYLEAAIKKYGDADPWASCAYYLLGLSYSQCGKPQQALQAFATCCRLPESHNGLHLSAQHWRIDLLLQLQRPAEAMAATKAYASMPGLPIMLAEVPNDMFRCAEAQAALPNVRDGKEAAVTMYRDTIAYVLKTRGRGWTNLPYVYRGLAHTQADTDQISEAIATYDEFLQQFPQNRACALVAMNHQRLVRGGKEETNLSVADLEQIIKTYPTNTGAGQQVLFELAQAFIRTQRLNEAATVLQGITNFKPAPGDNEYSSSLANTAAEELANLNKSFATEHQRQ